MFTSNDDRYVEFGLVDLFAYKDRSTWMIEGQIRHGNNPPETLIYAPISNDEHEALHRLECLKTDICRYADKNTTANDNLTPKALMRFMVQANASLNANVCKKLQTHIK